MKQDRSQNKLQEEYADIQQDTQKQTPIKNVTFQNQASQLQSSQFTPTTQHKNRQQLSNPHMNIQSQQQTQQNSNSNNKNNKDPTLYSLSTIGNDKASDLNNRDVTPKKQIMSDQQLNRNTITPKVGRQSNQKSDSKDVFQIKNSAFYQDENKSSFSNFQGLQESDMKSPGIQLSNIKQKNKQAQQNQELSPSSDSLFQNQSPVVLRGDIDDDFITSASLKESIEKVMQGDQSYKLSANKQANINFGRKQSKQLNEKNRIIKELLKREELNQEGKINKIQNDEMLNIKVQNNSQAQNQQILNTNNTNPNMSSDVEDSDIADEFEYLYDPEYQNQRLMSPQTRRPQASNNQMGIFHKRQTSNTPLTQKNQSMRLTKSTKKTNQNSHARTKVSPFRAVSDFGKGLEEYEKYELIKRTCKTASKNVDLNEIDRSLAFKNKKNEFINRMLIDACVRSNREKQLIDLQYVVAMKTNMDHDSISRSVSPQKRDNSFQNPPNQDMNLTALSPGRRNMKASIQSPNNQQSQIRTKITTQNIQTSEFESPNPANHFTHGPIFGSPSKSVSSSMILKSPLTTHKKKLKKNQCVEIYTRLMKHEQGRQQAIEMLQEAKRKDEDAEYLQSTGNRRISRRQKKQCYNRLVEDAERRKISLLNSQKLAEHNQRLKIKGEIIQARQTYKIKKNNTSNHKEIRELNLSVKKKPNQDQDEEEEEGLQNHYEKYAPMKHNLVQQQDEYEQQIQYEQYLMQREQDQEIEEQNEIINIQSHKSLHSNDDRHESSYESSKVEIQEENMNMFEAINHAPIVSKPKFKIGSNSMSGLKLSEQQLDQQNQVSSSNQNLQLIYEQSQDSITDEYYLQ